MHIFQISIVLCTIITPYLNGVLTISKYNQKILPKYFASSNKRRIFASEKH